MKLRDYIVVGGAVIAVVVAALACGDPPTGGDNGGAKDSTVFRTTPRPTATPILLRPTATPTSVPVEARLSLELSDIAYQFKDQRHYYYHTRTFTEANGVGATLTGQKLCFESTSDCNSVAVNIRIKPNSKKGSLSNSFGLASERKHFS